MDDKKIKESSKRLYARLKEYFIPTPVLGVGLSAGVPAFYIYCKVIYPVRDLIGNEFEGFPVCYRKIMNPTVGSHEGVEIITEESDDIGTG